MSGFDILSLVGEPWNDASGLFGGIDVSVTDTASLPTSKFLEFVLNGASIYRVLKTGETIISNATGTSLGGIKLAGSAGEMALTSQTDPSTSAPAEALRYSWEDTAHVGTDPASGSVLQGMGASNFSIEGAAKITHIAGSSAYAWSGLLGTRLIWTGNTAATNDGRTIDFTNVGQTNRASPIVSVSAANAADDLIQFGLSDGTNWTVAAKIDAAGRGQFQMLDLPEQGAPGDPAAGTARIYGKSVNGASKVAFRDSTGAETVLGSTILVSGGIVTASTPVASFSQTWNESSTVFTAITADVTDTASGDTSSLLDLKLNSGSVFQVRKSGETVITNTAGTSAGGIALRGGSGEMALTSQIDVSTGLPADAFRWYWEDPSHVGSDPASASVLRGMGLNRMSLESSAAFVHISQTARYEWEGLGSDRLLFLGYEAGSAKGKTFDFTNVGQTPTRASPIVSISAADAADDLIHFGLSDGTSNWTVAARIDAAGRGQFQMLDLPEQGAPGDPAAGTARVYGKNVNGASKVAFRDSTGAETVLGSTILVSGGIVTTSTPVASFSQTWNESSTIFNAITADVTDTASSATSSLLDLKLNSSSVFQVRKNGETVITDTAGTSAGGIALRGSSGEMALTSQIDQNTGLPADVFRWYWQDSSHIGTDPTSGSVLRGMGGSNFSIEAAAKITHIAGSSAYAWSGLAGTRLIWTGNTAATNDGRTIDFTNVGQTNRASPIMSVSAANAADDLIQFGLSDGTNWTVAAKVDAAGRGQFQMLDLPEQGAPGNPAAATARVYGKSVNGVSKVAFRDSTGAETVLGSTISVSGGTVTTSTPVASFSQTWNDSSVVFAGITANVTDTASRVTSSLIDLKVNSGSVFQVRKSGETVISNTAGTSRGGIALRGNAGEMALTSMIDPNSGLPADAFRWYWEDANHVGSDAASVSVLRGMGRNRMSLESAGAFVHIAQTARYEWEGLGSDRLLFLGYEVGSARGKTFDFSNYGQTPTRASPVVSISIDAAHPEDDALHICTLENGVWTTLSRFDGTGGLHVPRVDAVGASGAAPRYTASLSTDTELRAQIGLDSADRGMIKLGIGGTTAPDVMLSRGPFAGCLDISNGTNPSQIRIYRTYGDNAEFWNMTWRLTSPPWASIRTNFSGTGSARNICIEPALLGLGIPIGNGSNIPAFKRVATQIQVRLGDDSAFTSIRGKLTTADSAVPETIVPDSTLILYDANGTAYKVPCVAA